MKGTMVATAPARVPLFGRLHRHLVARRAVYVRWLRGLAVSLTAFVLAVLVAQWWDFTIPQLGRAEYQAVFLTNGQTYFGRYYDRLGAFAKIEDVYYIQQATTDSGPTADPRLVRRGAELHSPDHRMLVPKSAILFVEDLRSDSPIAQFMRQDQR